MLTNRHITKIVAILMVLAVGACLCAMAFSEQIAAAYGGAGVTMEYEQKLFDTSEVLEINIVMDETDWDAMLDNAMAEEYVLCDVEIGGDTFYQVGIRPKGNTSLSSIANDPTTDRYSLKLEFDQYVTGQTCYGLDKLILNNSYADTTYMKEALIYDMFQSIGADASLYNYAKVSVNGEYLGLYLALEAVEDSFMMRNYGAADGELYKPDSMNIGGGGDRGGMPDMGDMDFGNVDFSAMQPPESSEGEAGAAFSPFRQKFGETAPFRASGTDDTEAGTEQETFPGEFPGGGEMPDMGDFDPSEMFGGGGGFGGGMFGGGGANLNYSDDFLDSYSTIWEGGVTKTGDTDHERVVTALKNISQGTNLKQYMDIDNLVKYMAVHIFSENSDSLSGSMAHNYYLYESGGQLNILPWDYNLAFGGMGMGGGSGATDTVNGPIDDAWSGTNFFDTLLADEEYHASYYAAMAQVVDYLLNGSFEEFYTRTREQIDTLVETDPNAFYTYEEYLTGVETLYEIAMLRGQSIQGQLDGTIPSTSEAQRSSDALIDASHLDLSVLGSMNMGGGGGQRSRFSEERDRNREVDPTARPQDGLAEVDGQIVATVLTMRSQTVTGTDGTGTPPSFPQFGGGQGGFPFGGQMPEDFTPPQFDGELPEGFDPTQGSGTMPGEFTPPEESEGSAPVSEMPKELTPSQSAGEVPESTQPQEGSEQSEPPSEGSEESGDQGQMPPSWNGENGQGMTRPGGQGDQSQGWPGAGEVPSMGFDGSTTGSGLSDTVILYGISGVVMLAAFLFALFYRRKPRRL